MYKVIRNKNGKEWNQIVSIKPQKPFSKASQKEIFDYCIKRELLLGENYLPGINLSDKDESSFGFYLSEKKRFYDRYLSKRLNLDSVLSSDIKRHYDQGKGSELKSGKFYSVASSSRFTVSSFSEKSNQGIIELRNKMNLNGKVENVEIKLEEGLNIGGIPANLNPPQMDAMIKTNSSDTYFLEVKCHEIFDTSKNKPIKLKWKYLKADSFNRLPLRNVRLSKKTVIERGKPVEYISVDNKYLTASSFGCTLLTTHFDFKQFLCHLMGILSYKNRNKNRKESIHFYYLFYKNAGYLKIGKNKIYEELEAEISEIFGKFSKLFPEIDFGYCYNDKFDTIKSLKNEHKTTA